MMLQENDKAAHKTGMPTPVSSLASAPPVPIVFRKTKDDGRYRITIIIIRSSVMRENILLKIAKPSGAMEFCVPD